jgi:hypothetical protein
MQPCNFSVAPCSVIKMNQDGTISICSDHVENLDGVLDPKDLPKTEILKPSMDRNFPKGNWKDCLTGVVREDKNSVPDFYAMFGIESPKAKDERIAREQEEFNRTKDFIKF